MAKIPKKKTTLQHVFLIDWNDDGIMQEIAVVQELTDGTIRGIQIDKLHPIDKARLKKFVTSKHADKYELWQLLADGRLNNGMNALDFFHTNYIKVKRPKGAIVGGGLASVQVEATDKIIGSEFSDPTKAEIDRAAPNSFV
jgi:hypothetical protein